MNARELIHHCFAWEIAPGVAGDDQSASADAADGAAVLARAA